MAERAQIDLQELHWLLDIVQCLDVGVLVMDRNFRIEVWNSFMENHSGLGADQVQGRSLFQLFPEIDRVWLERKVGSVLRLGTRAFSLWQQRPYLLRFETYRPITGQADFMYQNLSIMPLAAAGREVEHVCLVIYDVTEAAEAQLRQG